MSLLNETPTEVFVTDDVGNSPTLPCYPPRMPYKTVRTISHMIETIPECGRLSALLSSLRFSEFCYSPPMEIVPIA
jgi:hypothetical protein